VLVCRSSIRVRRRRRSCSLPFGRTARRPRGVSTEHPRPSPAAATTDLIASTPPAEAPMTTMSCPLGDSSGVPSLLRLVIHDSSIRRRCLEPVIEDHLAAVAMTANGDVVDEPAHEHEPAAAIAYLGGSRAPPTGIAHRQAHDPVEQHSALDVHLCVASARAVLDGVRARFTYCEQDVVRLLRARIQYVEPAPHLRTDRGQRFGPCRQSEVQRFRPYTAPSPGGLVCAYPLRAGGNTRSEVRGIRRLRDTRSGGGPTGAASSRPS
jgi:hypothetical protein